MDHSSSTAKSRAVRRYIVAFVLANLFLPLLWDLELGLKVNFFQLWVVTTPVASTVAVIIALFSADYTYGQIVVWAIMFAIMPMIPAALLHEARFDGVVALVECAFALVVGALIIRHKLGKP